jgi:hypothetical protein
MKTLKVRLYLRVQLSDRRNAFVDPVWNGNRTLRASYALIGGLPEHHPEGTYYLRFLRSGKRVWQPLGPDPDVAVVVLRNTELDLRPLGLGRPVVGVLGDSQAQNVTSAVLLNDAVQTYLQEVRQFRAPKTVAACEQMLNLFSSRLLKRTLDSITRKDLIDHMVALRADGLGDRTIYNHVMRVGTCLITSLRLAGSVTCAVSEIQ